MQQLKDEGSKIASKKVLDLIDDFEDRVSEWMKSFDEYVKPWMLEAAGPSPSAAVTSALASCGVATTEEIFDWAEPSAGPEDAPGSSQPATAPVTGSKRGSSAPTSTTPKKRSRTSGRDLPSSHESESESAIDANKRVMSIAIPLPSGLPRELTAHPSLTLAAEIEMRHRQIQADFALVQVRTHLITVFGYTAAGPPNPGQTLGTRLQTTIKRKWDDVHTTADTYRRSRLAMLSLGMPQSDRHFRTLSRTDLTPFLLFSEEEELVRSSSSTRQGQREDQRDQQRLGLNKVQSWIWENLEFSPADGDPKIMKYYTESTCTFPASRR